ncbi:MAG: ParB/RepB/Spo0J family partition protein [Patescibacteria group bacterium]
MNRTGLGRGLNSLIPPRNAERTVAEEPVVSQGTNELPINDIQPNPHQPRFTFDRAALEDLMNSIKIHGIIQPLVVINARGGYQLIAGERRLRAAKLLGLKKVPAVIRTATEQEKLELAIVENVQRQSLNPIERARGFQRLIDEFNLTQDEVGKKVGQNRVTVTNSLRLLTLPSEMQQALAEGKLTEGHAKALLGVETAVEREKLFKEILKSGLSVRIAESQARRVSVRQHARRSKDPNMLEKEDVLQAALGTKVEIRRKGKRGTITVHFYSAEELQAIIRKISN